MCVCVSFKWLVCLQVDNYREQNGHINIINCATYTGFI